ncbi:hypothetical protein HDG33_005546 [Paraburkholderia sp. Cpub6]|nr:hypothetical protein [Paraburkholderia sp. Cpub6]
MNDTLVSLAAIFSQLALLAFGGGNTILPEMQRPVVDVHHWMPARSLIGLTRFRAGLSRRASPRQPTKPIGSDVAREPSSKRHIQRKRAVYQCLGLSY